MRTPIKDAAPLAGGAGVEANSAPDDTRNPTTSRDAALALAARGFPVVALHTPIQTGDRPVCSCSKCHHCDHIGKHPRHDRHTLPNGANSATINPTVIRKWWTLWPGANVGMAVGPAAGVLAIDIDPRNGGDDTFAALIHELGTLPDTVEAITGGGGRHLLFKHPGGRVRGTLGSGVDVLGSDGQLIVVEPSLHKSGSRYAWELSSAPDAVELAALPDSWRLKLCSLQGDGVEGGYRENREDGEIGTQTPLPTPALPALPAIPANPAIPVSPPEPTSGWTEERLFEETLPTGRGQHDRCSMRLARGAKFHLGYATPEAARALFDRWWDRAARFCAEEDGETAWFKFARGFDLARFPLDATDLAERALARAQAAPLPRSAQQLGSPKSQLLAATCYHLSQITRGSFKLSCHQIAGLFGVTPKRAWDWLRALERRLIIRCVDRGQGGQTYRRAATFEYIALDNACIDGSSGVDSRHGPT